MQVKKLEELSNGELRQRMVAIYDLCGDSKPHVSTTKERLYNVSGVG